MIPEKKPVTGHEDKNGLTGPLLALTGFYDAFNNRDLKKMSMNWAQTDEIAMDNPVGGIKRGWEDIRAVYERIFNGPARVYVEFHDYTIHEAVDMFYAVGRERGEFRSGETVVKLAIRTSRIYRLTDGRWQQVHHHGSIDNPELLAQYQTAVKSGI
ncbi:MAG: nuclear transport factor 2 family protein [Deltaproteobacteria bacterium]|nr:nuclear transport factor 2 family protein [Deltaproteobacteria bacterium]